MTKKTTNVNETPGWNGSCLVYVEWLLRGHVYGRLVYRTCGRTPRKKEIGDVLVAKLPMQPHGIWALL